MYYIYTAKSSNIKQGNIKSICI